MAQTITVYGVTNKIRTIVAFRAIAKLQDYQLSLKDAKSIADDLMQGIPCEILCSDSEAAIVRCAFPREDLIVAEDRRNVLNASFTIPDPLGM